MSDWCRFYNADVKALEALQIAKQLRASLAAMEGAEVSAYLSAVVGAPIFQHRCMRLLLPGVGMTHVYHRGRLCGKLDHEVFRRKVFAATHD